MNKKLEIIRILNNSMVAYMIATVLFICAGMPGDSALFAGNLLLVVFVIISEAVQFLCSQLFLFLLGHGVGIAFCTFLSLACGTQHLGFTITRVFFMIVMTIIAINIKMGNGAFFYPTIPEAFLFVAMMIPCKLAHARDAELVVLLCEVLWGILAVLFYNTRQTAGAISVFKDRARVPYDSILKTNRLMLTVYLGIALLAMFICTLLDYGKQIMAVVGAVVRAVLKWFFSMLDLTVEDEAPPSAPLEQSGGSFIPMGQDDSWLRIIWDVLFWMAGIVAAIGFIYLFFKAVRLFIKFFNEQQIGIRDRLSRDKVEYLKPTFDESKEGRGSGRKNRIPLSKRLTTRGQVRLLYKRFIKSGSGYGNVRMSFSPEEQIDAAYGAGPRNADIRRLYEQARYSSREVSTEDVKNMRKTVKT